MRDLGFGSDSRWYLQRGFNSIGEDGRASNGSSTVTCINLPLEFEVGASYGGLEPVVVLFYLHALALLEEDLSLS